MQDYKAQMFSSSSVSEGQAHNSDTGGLFQMSKQQMLPIPPPLNVVPELVISWAVPAMWVVLRDVVALCTKREV